MTFLVTGGAGFIGSTLVDRLAKKGEVRVLDNLETGHEDFLNPDVEFIKGDIRDLKTVEAAVKGCQGIFHLAAQPSVIRSVEDPQYDSEVNITGTLNVLQAAKKEKTKVVYSSSCATYGDALYLPVDENHQLHPKCPYGASKLAAEKMCESFFYSFGLDTVSLRFFNVYGPKQQDEDAGVVSIFLRQAIAKKDLTIFGDGEQFRDFVFVEDVVEAMILAFEKNPKERIMNIGTGKKTSVNEIADSVLDLQGGVKKSYLPEREGESKGMQADISLVKKELGFEPKVDLKEGIKRTFDWCSSLS